MSYPCTCYVCGNDYSTDTFTPCHDPPCPWCSAREDVKQAEKKSATTLAELKRDIVSLQKKVRSLGQEGQWVRIVGAWTGTVKLSRVPHVGESIVLGASSPDDVESRYSPSGTWIERQSRFARVPHVREHEIYPVPGTLGRTLDRTSSSSEEEVCVVSVRHLACRPSPGVAAPGGAAAEVVVAKPERGERG